MCFNTFIELLSKWNNKKISYSVCDDEGIEVMERNITRDELYTR